MSRVGRQAGKQTDGLTDRSEINNPVIIHHGFQFYREKNIIHDIDVLATFIDNFPLLMSDAVVGLFPSLPLIFPSPPITSPNFLFTSPSFPLLSPHFPPILPSLPLTSLTSPHLPLTSLHFPPIFFPLPLLSPQLPLSLFFSSFLPFFHSSSIISSSSSPHFLTSISLSFFLLSILFPFSFKPSISFPLYSPSFLLLPIFFPFSSIPCSSSSPFHRSPSLTFIPPLLLLFLLPLPSPSPLFPPPPRHLQYRTNSAPSHHAN